MKVNRWLLMWTRDNLYARLAKMQQETVKPEENLRLIMMSLADMCSALARESEDDKVPGYNVGSGADDDEQ